jgi:signal transduction histidine kinase
VNNALRHAEATAVSVELRYDPERLVLKVSDNGKDFDPDAIDRRNGYWGLGNMQEWADKICAEWKIESAPGSGTKIETVVPSVSNEKVGR